MGFVDFSARKTIYRIYRSQKWEDCWYAIKLLTHWTRVKYLLREPLMFSFLFFSFSKTCKQRQIYVLTFPIAEEYSQDWNLGEFEGETCTCPLATCEKLHRGASSPSLVFIKCVEAKRLINGNALKQIDHTGSQSQGRTCVVYRSRIRRVIGFCEAEDSWI